MLFWIIIFFLGLVIVRKVHKIVVLQRCATDDDLKDYFEGRLKKQDQDEYERIIGHLGICEKCQTKLTEMAQIE